MNKIIILLAVFGISTSAFAGEICGKVTKVSSNDNQKVVITILTDDGVRENITRDYTLYRGLNPGQLLAMVAYISGERYCTDGKKSSVSAE